MKKSIIIIPYFGTFPSFFQLFLNSCRYNETFTWLIYTDDHTEYDYPKNVLVNYIAYHDFIDKIQNKFDFKVEINRPHKLCDFKVAYGYIFENEIKEYDYWGHGDLDVIYGNLDNFVTPLIEKGYDKIYSLGHLSLYKNTYLNNRIFMDEYEGDYPYKTIFSTDKAFAFDEWHCPIISINHLFLRRNTQFFQFNECANLSSSKSNFVLSNYIVNFQSYCIDNNSKNIYSYEKGKLLRHFIQNNKIKQIEYPYIHFHKRRMSVKCNNTSDKMIIVPNEFRDYLEIDYNLIKKYCKSGVINMQYFKVRFINLRYRFKQMLK